VSSIVKRVLIFGRLAAVGVRRWRYRICRGLKGERAVNRHARLLGALMGYALAVGAGEANVPSGCGDPSGASAVPHAKVVRGSLAAVVPSNALVIRSVQFPGDAALVLLRGAEDGGGITVELGAELARQCALAPGLVVAQVGTRGGPTLFIPGSMLAFVAEAELQEFRQQDRSRVLLHREVAAQPLTQELPMPPSAAVPVESQDRTETDELAAYAWLHGGEFRVASPSSTGLRGNMSWLRAREPSRASGAGFVSIPSGRPALHGLLASKPIRSGVVRPKRFWRAWKQVASRAHVWPRSVAGLSSCPFTKAAPKLLRAAA
jgi:hypothetical protein